MQAIQINLMDRVRYAMVRCPMKKHPIDTKWFLQRMEDMDLTMHSLAPQMQGRNGKLDYHSLYHLMHGLRAMSLAEAVQLSELLKTPLETIARKALGKTLKLVPKS